MRRGMLLLGFWMCVCMVFLVNAQEHTSRKLYCTDAVSYTHLTLPTN